MVAKQRNSCNTMVAKENATDASDNIILAKGDTMVSKKYTMVSKENTMVAKDNACKKYTIAIKQHSGYKGFIMVEKNNPVITTKRHADFLIPTIIDHVISQICCHYYKIYNDHNSYVYESCLSHKQQFHRAFKQIYSILI